MPNTARRLQQWRMFLAGDTTSLVRDAIVESWERSAMAGVDPESSGAIPRVPPGELEERIARNRRLIDIATPFLVSLHENCAGESSVCYLADADGIVLVSLGSEEVLLGSYLVPGHDWSEKTAGTNGAGTCLVTGRPVAIVGSEHFRRTFHGYTCTAAPIRDASGRVIAAIDVSSPAEDARPERLRIVTLAAGQIERALREDSGQEA